MGTRTNDRITPKARVFFRASEGKWVFDGTLPADGSGKRKRIRKRFDTEREAKQRARQWLDHFRDHGLDGQVDVARYQQLMILSARLSEIGRTLEEVAEEALSAGPITAKQMTLEDACAEFLCAQRAKGIVRRWEKELEWRLDKFAACFPGWTLSQFKTADIERYLDGLGPNAGNRKNNRATLHSLWVFACRRLGQRSNPVDGIDVPRLGRSTPGTISARDCKRLFRFLELHRPDLIPYNALRAFGGLREAETHRLTWDNIRHGEGIYMPPENGTPGRSKRSGFVAGLPGNLWAWLAPFAGLNGRVAKTNAMLETREILQRLKIDYPQNGMRHSFCTYHLELFRNPAETAMVAGHKENPRMLFEHYRGLREKSEAEAYFAIKPVLQFAHRVHAAFPDGDFGARLSAR
jgi:integrase